MNSPNNNEGYLYIVYNPIFAKNVYKLGRTNNLKTNYNVNYDRKGYLFKAVRTF